MADDTKEMWERASAELLTRLPGSQKEVEAVRSPQEIQRQLELLQKKYSKRKSAHWFHNLQPILDWVWGFNLCVQNFLQASPSIFILLWGSLSFALEFASRYYRGLEALTDCIETISFHLPRLEWYRSKWTTNAPEFLKKPLVEYYVQLLEFFFDAGGFFKNRLRTQGNLLRTSLKTVQKSRLEKLKELAFNSDRAAHLAILIESDNKQSRLLRLVGSQTSPLNEMLVGNIPFDNLPRRNSSFFSRESELEHLHSVLNSDACRVKASCTCIHGLPGSGKSQLALEFAHKNESNYDVIMWISAETQSKLAESFGCIARGLGLVKEGVQQHLEEQQRLLLRWFKNTSRLGKDRKFLKWLVIFDNVTNVSTLDPYLPHATAGSVIITCKSPEVAKHFSGNFHSRIHLDCFSTKVATDFLLAQVEKDGSCSTEQELARRISNAVGNHPLALDMVGSYIRRCGRSLQAFLKDHPTFERDFLFRSDSMLGFDSNHQRLVSDVFAMNFGPANLGPSLDSASRLLIEMLAFLDPDGAPLNLFQGNTRETMLFEGPDELHNFPELSNALESPFENTYVLNRSLQTLLDLALITMDDSGERLRCHQLVRVAAEKAMSVTEISFVFNQLVFFLNSSFPIQLDGQPLLSKWAECDELAGNVVSVVESYERHQNDIPAPMLLAEVACRCSWYYYEKGQYAMSIDMADKQISLCNNALQRGNHPGYSEWFVRDMISHQVNTKASVAKEVPFPDQGLSLSEQVIHIREENRRELNDEDDKWIAAAQGNLAVSLMAVSRDDEALCILLNLVQRPDMKSNEDIYLRNICLCWLRMCCWEQALEAIERAEEVVTRLWGVNTAQMAKVSYYASKIHEGLGNTSDALEALRRSLVIRNAIMPHHHHTALTFHRMGVMMESAKGAELAVPFYRKACEILSKSECHPGAACRSALALAGALKRCGFQQEAADCLKIAEKERLKITDVDTSDFGVDCANYDRFVVVDLR